MHTARDDRFSAAMARLKELDQELEETRRKYGTDKLYAAGGINDDGFGILSSVERYDPATNAWEAVAPLATERMNHGVAVLDGKLYAVGGYNDDDDFLSSVERYDPATNAWEAAAPLTTARCLHGITVA